VARANTEASCFQEKIDAADKKYEEKEYNDSISLYKEAYNCANDKSQKIKSLASLATSEHSIGNIKATKEYLNQLLEISPNNMWAKNFIENNKIDIAFPSIKQDEFEKLPDEYVKLIAAIKNYQIYSSGQKSLSEFTTEEKQYMLKVANYYVNTAANNDSASAQNDQYKYISNSIIAYQTKVESDNNEIIKLENDAIVQVSSYVGYIGYRKDAVLYGSRNDCNIWISGKKSFKCELIKEPSKRGEPAEKIYISEVKGNGKILMMLDGRVYEVGMLDELKTTLWLGMSDGIIINGTTLINFSSDESIQVNRIK
jgi:hypothetical protein